MDLADIEHSLDEILTVLTEYPGNADDKIFFQRLRDSQFPFKLGLAINVEGLVILAIRLPRLRPLPIEYIIRTEIEHLTVQFLADIGNMLRPTGIDRPDLSHFVVIFGHIDSRPSRTVDDCIGLHIRYDPPYGISVGNIQRHIRRRRHCRPISHPTVHCLRTTTHRYMTAADQFIHHIMTQLAIHTRYQNLHRIRSPFMHVFLCHTNCLAYLQRFAADRLSSAARSSNRLAPSVGRHLMGWKGFGTAPTAYPRLPYIFW